MMKPIFKSITGNFLIDKMRDSCIIENNDLEKEELRPQWREEETIEYLEGFFTISFYLCEITNRQIFKIIEEFKEFSIISKSKKI